MNNKLKETRGKLKSIFGYSSSDDKKYTEFLKNYIAKDEVGGMKEKSYKKGLAEGRRPYTLANRKSRAKYKEADLCRVCGKKPLKGTLCEIHRKKQNEKQKRYTKRRKQKETNG